MSSRAFCAAGVDNEDHFFPNLKGLGVGDTDRPLGRGHRRVPLEDTCRHTAPLMVRERA